MDRTEKELRESISDMNESEAIEYLENHIFYEEMADYMNHHFVRICNKLIHEIKERTRK